MCLELGVDDRESDRDERRGSPLADHITGRRNSFVATRGREAGGRCKICHSAICEPSSATTRPRSLMATEG